MNTFLQLCNDTEMKLGRKLQIEEVYFLEWMYLRYHEEQSRELK